MKRYPHWRNFPMDEWRWPSFSPREMASKDWDKSKAGELGIDTGSMDKLQALRNDLGVPLIVNSAYRSQNHNTEVGGAKASQHLVAKGFDISMTNHNPAVFLAAAKRAGFTSFGFYPKNNFIHIDDRAKSATWGKKWFDDNEKHLPSEPVLQPEAASKDPVTIGAVVTGLGAGGSFIGRLSDYAQIAAIAGAVVIAVGLLIVFRDRIKLFGKRK